MQVCFFSPFADVWPAAQLSHILIRMSQIPGWEISLVTCNGLLSQGCISMQGAGITKDSTQDEKGKVCKSCRVRRSVLVNSSGCNHVLIDDFVLDINRSAAKDLANGINSTNWINFEIANIPVGRIAAYEFLLQYKIVSEEIPDELMDEYRGQLQNCIMTYYAALNYFSQNKMDRLIVTNNLYSQNNIFRTVARQFGVLTYGVHSGIDRSISRNSIVLSKEVEDIWDSHRGNEYKVHRVFQLSEEVCNLITNSFVCSAKKSRKIYRNSFKRQLSPQTVREKLDISASQKVVLCPTTSYDEIFSWSLLREDYGKGDSPKVFLTQTQWLEEINRIAERRLDLKFIIRVHPREFPNYREGVMSPSALMLRSKLNRTPQNVFVNWPEQNLGLYELLQVSDAVLSGYSSVGGEALMLGLPVVCHEHMELIAYPTEMTIRPRSSGEYEECIDRALTAGWDFERVRQMYKWKSFLFTQVEAELGSDLPYRVWSKISEATRFLERKRSTQFPDWISRVISRKALLMKLDKESQHRFIELLETGAPSLQSISSVRRFQPYDSDLKYLREGLSQMVKLLPRNRKEIHCLQKTISNFLEDNRIGSVNEKNNSD